MINWVDYIRGFEEGQQDRGSASETDCNPLLLLWMFTGALLFLVLVLCFTLLKGLTWLVGLVVLMILPQKR